MKLVIVESPSKAKTINKYLGDEYKVISSVGHIIDLPKSKIGIDIENNFEPIYETIPGKEKVIRELKSNAKNADSILLATDPDREGEAISWHIKNSLGKLKKEINRIVFHEITKDAIKEALKHPREIDQSLVDAQQARRVLDRLVGYTLSPFLWKKIRYGLSAGRVQSVALRLIVDRERERQEFKAEEYWDIKIIPSDSNSKSKISKLFKDDEKSKEEVFYLELKKINNKKAEIKNEKEFDEIIKDIDKKEIKIIDLAEKKIKKRPYPPFTTSTFQQAAVNTLGMTSKNAMRSAQKLYEAGLITYMRTDSLSLSAQSITAARKIIKKDFGTKYLPEKPNLYKTSSKSAQEAHEAIRPTNFETTAIAKNFSVQDEKVYNLIYKRALASQMEDGIFTQKTIIGNIKSKKDYELTSTAQKCDFDGWLRLYKVNEDKNALKIIESIKVGSNLFSKETIGTQHFTEPPARYTEASLIKALEKYGIGRPSTYASIVSVIMQRDYVMKDGKYFFPTEVGCIVTDLLKNHFTNIVDIDFTANMENDLDKIAEGDTKWQPIVKDFYKPFLKQIEKKDKEIKKEDLVVLGDSDEKCDLCGNKMIKKIGRFGVFLSCSNFPKCKGIKSLNDNAAQSEAVSEEFLSQYKPAPKTDEGKDYELKKGRFGFFWAHPDYPQVKDIKSLEYTNETLEKLFGKPPKSEDGKKMILKKGRFGFFWAHPDYPKVKEIKKALKKKTK